MTGAPETGRGAAALATGFGLSVVLTLTAYWFVAAGKLSGSALIAIIVGLAIAQLLVQLFFFLHLGHERAPRWWLTALVFMLVVLAILVFGSLWIMSNLDHHMGAPGHIDRDIIEDEGYRP